MKVKKAPIQPRGRFGKYGGQYVPETLVKPLQDLEEAYDEYSRDPSFKKELRNLLESYAGRPTPLYLARNLTENIGGARIYLKREDLLPWGTKICKDRSSTFTG